MRRIQDIFLRKICENCFSMSWTYEGENNNLLRFSNKIKSTIDDLPIQ